MSPPFESPAVRYGMAFSSAALIGFIAFAFLDGIARWIALAMAVAEIVVVPQILKRAV